VGVSPKRLQKHFSKEYVSIICNYMYCLQTSKKLLNKKKIIDCWIEMKYRRYVNSMHYYLLLVNIFFHILILFFFLLLHFYNGIYLSFPKGISNKSSHTHTQQCSHWFLMSLFHKLESAWNEMWNSNNDQDSDGHTNGIWKWNHKIWNLSDFSIT
jgi:hypothetical protein